MYCPDEPGGNVRQWVDSPARYGISRHLYLDLFVPLPSGARMHAFLMHVNTPHWWRAPTLLILHGNAGTCIILVLCEHALYFYCASTYFYWSHISSEACVHIVLGSEGRGLARQKYFQGGHGAEPLPDARGRFRHFLQKTLNIQIFR